MIEERRDPEFDVYLRTYQGSENPTQKQWRRNVIALWQELNMMGRDANAALRRRVEYLGNRGPRRDLI